MEASNQFGGPEQIDRHVDGLAAMHCQGKMSPRDQLLAALNNQMQGAALTKKTPEFCAENYATVKKLKGQVKPKDDEDQQIIHLDRTSYHNIANCFARAGDCKQAWSSFVEAFPADSLANVKDQKTKDTILKSSFESTVPKCKEKKAG
jgi:hypothetical protein